MTMTAIVFPGQGSQYVGMGQALSQQHACVTEALTEASEAISVDLARLCWEGPDRELTLTANAQPAILALSIGMYRAYLDELGASPDVVAGHSLGEFTALVAAGALDFRHAIRLVRRRGELMQQASAEGAGAMAAIKETPLPQIQGACVEANTNDEVVVVSNLNGPGEVVISGHSRAVARASEALRARGAEVVALRVSAPFHSPLMQEAARAFAEDLAQCEFRDPEIPVLSNVTAKAYPSASEIPGLLERQMAETVDWLGVLRTLEEMGTGRIVEVGPKSVLTKLAKKTLPAIESHAIERGFEPLRGSGNQPDSQPLNLLERCLAIAVCTKNRGTDGDRYQTDVVAPYREVQQMLQRLDGKAPGQAEQEFALTALKRIFDAKATPAEEQKERFQQLLRETGAKGLLSRHIDGLGVSQ